MPYEAKSFTEVRGRITFQGLTGQASMFFLLLATHPASPPNTPLRNRDIRAKISLVSA